MLPNFRGQPPRYQPPQHAGSHPYHSPPAYSSPISVPNNAVSFHLYHGTRTVLTNYIPSPLPIEPSPMAIPLVPGQVGLFAAGHSCTRMGNPFLQVTVAGVISMKLTFAPSAAASYHLVALTVARKRAKIISVPVSPVTDVAAHRPIRVAHLHNLLHYRRGCSRLWRRRRIALGRMVMKWSARSAWWNMKSETSWLVWSACVNSTSSVLWNGLDGSKSALFTKFPEPHAISQSPSLLFFFTFWFIGTSFLCFIQPGVSTISKRNLFGSLCFLCLLFFQVVFFWRVLWIWIKHATEGL